VLFGGMWQSRRMQWAPPEARAVPRIFDRLVRLRPAQAWLLILLFADLTALIDVLTGPDLWVGPGYLLVMCVAAWSLGWRAGQLTGVACMGLTFAINGVSLYPYGDADLAWNLAMRFGAISIVIAIVAGVRRAYVREWWLARTDILTGALNRQAFFELAQPAIDSQGWRLLLFADLDGLKKVNDVQGHAAGDASLRAYGAAVRKMIRHDDLFARVGGDEFVVFISIKDESAARAVAARLHNAMNSISAEGGKLSCSVGGLTVPPGRASIDALVRSADNLMYEAKQRGAGLQLGVAADIERPAVSRARLVPRSTRVVVGPGGIKDRRAYPASLARDPVPR
jgi:diguanylate cyclase (GGDEF)-like protein